MRILSPALKRKFSLILLAGLFACSNSSIRADEIELTEAATELSDQEATQLMQEIIAECQQQEGEIALLEGRANTIRAKRRGNYSHIAKNLISSLLKKFPASKFPWLNKLLYGGVSPENPEFYDTEVVDSRDFFLHCHCASFTKRTASSPYSGVIYVPLFDNSKSLFKLGTNPEEFSAILSHEMAHLHQQHIPQRFALLIPLVAYAYGLAIWLKYKESVQHYKIDKESMKLTEVNPISPKTVFAHLGTLYGILLPSLFAQMRSHERQADQISCSIKPEHCKGIVKAFVRFQLVEQLFQKFLELQPHTKFQRFTKSLGKAFTPLRKVFRTHPEHAERITNALHIWQDHITTELKNQGIDAEMAKQQAAEQVLFEFSAIVNEITDVPSPQELKEIMLATFGLQLTMKRMFASPLVFDEEVQEKLYAELGTMRNKLLANGNFLTAQPA